MTDDNYMTPIGIMDRMQKDMETEAMLNAAKQILFEGVRKYSGIPGEEWRTLLFEEPLRAVEGSIRRVPSNLLIYQMMDDDMLEKYVEWYYAQKEKEKEKEKEKAI